MSKTTVVYPIVACLDEACKFLKTKDSWNSVNDMQTALLDRCYSQDVEDLEKIKDILESMSSTDNEALMKFFKDRGFEFDIKPFRRNEFGIGSVLSVLVEWLKEYEKYTVHIEDKSYSGVQAKENFEVYSSYRHEYPIVMLETKTDEKIYITIADKEYESLDLLARIKDIDNSRIVKADSLAENYDSVIFPMVDLEHDVDISWVVGINVDDADGMNWHIAKALQKTRFKMNHIGAKAESAVYMDCCLACSSETKPIIVIDKPFFVWMTRPELHDPLFVGYISEEDWKDPGDFHNE